MQMGNVAPSCSGEPPMTGGNLWWLLTCSEGKIRDLRRRPKRNESDKQEDATTELRKSKLCQEMWRSQRDEGKQAGRRESRERVMERRGRREEESAEGKQKGRGWSCDGRGGGEGGGVDVLKKVTLKTKKRPRSQIESIPHEPSLFTDGGGGVEPAASGMRSIH